LIAYITVRSSLEGRVILLGLIKCLASITFDMRLLVSLLAQNHHNYVINSITHNFKGKTPIGWLTNGGIIRKDEWGMFAQNKRERLSGF